MTALNVRKASLADIPLIREMAFSIWPQTYTSLISKDQIDYMIEMMYSQASIKKQMSQNSRYILLYDQKEPIGYAAYFQQSTTIFKLDKLYVLPSQQGKGSGKFLMDKIISDIKMQGVNVLQLQVHKKNNARSFYEKCGFYIIEAIEFNIGHGYIMDDYIMERKIIESVDQ